MRNGLWMTTLLLAFFVQPGLSAQVVLPASGHLAGPLDPATSVFGDEFFNFPEELGNPPPPGVSPLSGWIEITFAPPDGNLVDFFLDYDGVGADEHVTFGGGQAYVLTGERMFSSPLFPNGGTLDLTSGEIVAIQINPLARNTIIAQTSRNNRFPFAFAASYPPPDPALLGIPPEALPPELFEPGFLFAQAAFSYDAAGGITGFHFIGRSAVLGGILASLNPLFPPELRPFPLSAFGPNGEMYFANPASCEPQASFCPTDEDNPDGIRLPPDVFFHPEAQLGTSELREVDAQRLVPPCLPASASRGVLVAAGEMLFYVGGVDAANAATAETWVYDSVPGQWSAGPPMPFAVKDAQGAAFGSQVYVYGGRRSRGGITDRLQILDTTTGTWTQGPRGPVRVAAGVAAVVGEKLYVLGGRSRRGAAGMEYNDSVLVYTPASGWEQTRIDPPFLREGASAAVVDDEIYLLSGRRLDPEVAMRVTGDVTVFDAGGGSFLPGPRMLWGVYEGSAVALGDRIYVIGGRRGRGGQSLAEVQTLAIGEAHWRRTLPMPYPVADAGGARLGEEIFVAGGRNVPARGGLPATTLAATQALDPGLGWSVCGSLPLYTSDSLLNSAALSVGPRELSPGSVASLVGHNFGSDAEAISVEMDGQPAAVLAVSPNRVDLGIPPFLEAGTSMLQLWKEGSPVPPPIPVPIADVAPGIFVESYGEIREPLFLDRASAIACNSDGSLNHASDPAARGEQVTFRATGLGTAPADVMVYVDGIAVVPDAVGLDGFLFAVTVTVPDGARAANRVPLWLEVAGVVSNRASLAVGQVANPRPLPCP